MGFFCSLAAYGAPIETVVVTASPLANGGIDPNTLPGSVESFSAVDVADHERDVIAHAAAAEFSDISLNDEQGSQFQPDLVYRGFEASPISGVAEGIAVYQNGVRMNEAFGDAVNWDLIPEFAINRFTLESNNPLFGLNALGGAVSLQMKDGFNFDGAEAEASGGSFGNMTGTVQYGGRYGDVGVYVGGMALNDEGFRRASNTTQRQGYADIGYEDGRATLHLSLGAAHDDLHAPGPTPVELLAQNIDSVFTLPQAIRNGMELAQLRGSYALSDTWHLSGNAYYRQLRQHLTDGNTTDVAACDNDPAQFCLEGDGDFPRDALFDQFGRPVPVSVLPPGAMPGETDFTRTLTRGYGAAAEMRSSATLFGLANTMIVGASVDRGDTAYTAFGELGTLLPNLRIADSGAIIDQGNSPTAQPPIEGPVSVGATNTFGGIYGIDSLEVLPGWTWTFSGRLNTADIHLNDRLATALDGHHSFSRFDPGLGFAYKLAPVATAYAGYSESNRAPTPGELSCANPASPCLLDTFLVSDPPLKQVVSRNYEAGLRGNISADDGELTWSLGVYRNEVADDILLLATDVNGFGFFSNAGTTRHQGFDARLAYNAANWHVSLGYSFLDATFRNALTLASDSPAANAAGLIFVKPGDMLPLMPRNRITLNAGYDVTAMWRIGADLRYQSSMFLAGDASNQQAPISGFTTVDLHSAYRVAKGYELFGEIENLFDKHYFNYGAFIALDGIPPSLHLGDPRTLSPGMGRAFFGGIRVSF